MKYLAYRLWTVVLLTIVAAAAANAGQAAKQAQVVLISFDGAHALSQWERSRALSRNSGARFTYFLSCTYLLSSDARHRYRGPGKNAGVSNVGFAESRHEVAGRLRQIWAARREGHEIASHGCGHFDGKNWNTASWKTEHNSFTKTLADAWTVNRIPFEPPNWRRFAATEITGFRAPYLATNRAMYRALAETGFDYDASGVTKGPSRPVVKDRLYRLPLPTIPEGPKGRRIIAMDYNLYVRHSAGLERPSAANVFADRTYRALMAAFERQLSGGRKPLSIGFHFTLMNGGAYWSALERFASDVCGKPEVDCITHRDYVARLKAQAIGG